MQPHYYDIPMLSMDYVVLLSLCMVVSTQVFTQHPCYLLSWYGCHGRTPRQHRRFLCCGPRDRTSGCPTLVWWLRVGNRQNIWFCSAREVFSEKNVPFLKKTHIWWKPPFRYTNSPYRMPKGIPAGTRSMGHSPVLLSYALVRVACSTVGDVSRVVTTHATNTTSLRYTMQRIVILQDTPVY